MGRFGIFALKGLGILVLAFVVLSVVLTVVGVLLWLVGTAISLLVTLAVLALFVLAGIGLYTVMRGGGDSSDGRARYEARGRDEIASERDPKSALREQYVDGNLTDAEFERELERVLSNDEYATGGTREEPPSRSVEDLDVGPGRERNRERDSDR